MSDERAVISATPTQCAARRTAVHDCVHEFIITASCGCICIFLPQLLTSVQLSSR